MSKRHSSSGHDIQQVIDDPTALAGWPLGKMVVREKLGDGPTNETWRVTCGREAFVLRRVKPFARTIGLSLENELKVVRAAAKQRLTPDVVAASVDRGFVLTRFVEGRTWTVDDLRDKNQLCRLAELLNQVHRLECDVPVMDWPSILHAYTDLSSDPCASAWRDEALAQLKLVGSREPVVCHNDLTAPNIIDDGELRLIDWEFSAGGDPLFDLAVIVSHHDLDASATERLLSGYSDQFGDREKADLVRWRDIYQNLLRLWSSHQRPEQA